MLQQMVDRDRDKLVLHLKLTEVFDLLNPEIIFKAKIPRSSALCDTSAISILPSNAKQWMCDRPFTSTAVVKHTRCFLTCNYGFEVVQGELSI